MEIIIEYSLINNVIFTFLILFLSAKMLKKQIKFWQYFFACALGSVSALFLPVLTLPNALIIAIKMITGILICEIAFPSRTMKNFFANFCTFLCFTAAVGGICFMIIYIITGEINAQQELPVPLGIILLTAFLFCLILSKLITHFYRKKHINDFTFNIELKDNEKSLQTTAFLDSGNTLVDPVTDKPVTIISYNLFSQIFSVPIDKILLRKINEINLKNCHYINFNTLNNKTNQMLVFEVNELKIQNEKFVQIYQNAIVGLSLQKFTKNLNCGAIIPPQLVA